jgi:hypothetical protein
MSDNLKYEGCPQCGARGLKWDDNMLRCVYCDSVFEVVPETKPKVIVCKGANVVFGKGVTIGGDLKIEPGANVKFNGKLNLVRKGSGEQK